MQALKRKAFIGLGSNLGDRFAYLRAGLTYLPDVVAVSPVYETEPVGGPRGQDRYLNMVAELWSSASARQLLKAGQRAEAAAGRAREVHWGRGFVLVPLADLAPELVGDRLTAAMRAGVSLAGTI